MKRIVAYALIGLGLSFLTPVGAAVLYNNLTPTNAIAMATRPGGASGEIETADDFVFASRSSVTSASFTGLFVPGTSGTPFPVQVVIEIYRVFPDDSNVARTPQVPTRVNSPSDVAFSSRDATSGLSFSTSVLSSTFTANNSIQPGGIHPTPNQTTLGNGPVTGQEVQFDVTFATPFDLPADHYFFVPQVLLSDGAQFYWLSAPRPIGGGGTTPITPDLQAWTRDALLDPDWLRVGTDIVGSAGFNAAFALNGTTVPEPSTVALMSALALIALQRRASARIRQRG